MQDNCNAKPNKINKRKEIRLNKRVVVVKTPTGKYKIESDPISSPCWISEKDIAEIIKGLIDIVINEEEV